MISEETRTQKIEWFRQKCRECQLAATVQRLAVYDYLIQTITHPTADQVFEAVSAQFPTISRTSVYRILDTLAENGIIKRLFHTGSAVRYDADIGPHHHYICSRCGRVIDSPATNENPIPAGSLGPSGFRITDCSVVFSGLCADCQDGETEGKIEKNDCKAN